MVGVLGVGGAAGCPSNPPTHPAHPPPTHPPHPQQTFWFCSYFPEPLSLAAQSLLARDRAHPERMAHLAGLLLRCAAAGRAHIPCACCRCHALLPLALCRWCRSRHRGPPASSRARRSGAVLGVLLTAAVGAIFTRGAWLFTSDAAVQAGVRQLAPIGMLAIAVCSGGGWALRLGEWRAWDG